MSSRSAETELIDDPALPEAEFAAAIDDLAKVNWWLRGHDPTLHFLERQVSGMRSFSLLDVGAGQGDTLRAIERWATKRGIQARLTGIDLAAGGALAAGRAGTSATYLIGDVFDHDEQYDVIVSSLFTHHLNNDMVVRFMRWMDQHAVRGWHINDLHRHSVADWSFAALSAAMRWHPIVRHDGRVSVRRAFTRDDWERLANKAGVDVDIRWHPMFRWGVTGGI
ncbi:MAG: methyltransferase domain-containing protein [Pacificimonas sp.]